MKLFIWFQMQMAREKEIKIDVSLRATENCSLFAHLILKSKET